MKEEFKNTERNYQMPFSKIVKVLYQMMKEKSKETTPKSSLDIPVNYLSKKDLMELEDYSVIRLGHSTLLYKVEGEFILTDPVFSKRVSPFTFMGPKRFHEVPIDIESLPNIHTVIISHDHYDHLDKVAVKKLHHKVKRFYVPLKVGERLKAFGVPSSKIVELDWWKSHNHDNFCFICTPAQHFSGRGIFDKNKTLWSSWVILTPKARLFFGADGGYFRGFKEIGWNYGPFDMSFLEAGAYNKMWDDMHMMPEHTIQAHKDLQAKVLFPIHNGTFSLSTHSWYDPFERIHALAKKENINVNFPIMGEAVSIHQFKESKQWWQ